MKVDSMACYLMSTHPCYDVHPDEFVSDGFENDCGKADSCAAKFCLF